MTSPLPGQGGGVPAGTSTAPPLQPKALSDRLPQQPGALQPTGLLPPASDDEPTWSAASAACERLYGDAGARIRAAAVAVVGIGGVGSWAVEALARSGVGGLTLIDLDHVAESNINRQIHALGTTLGKAKVQAMRERIAQIHPAAWSHAGRGIRRAENWPPLLPRASTR